MDKKKEYKFIPEKGEVEVTIKSLSIRSGEPSTKVDKPINKTNAHAGERLKYIGYVLDGELYEGISKWYLNSDGNFFWGGGVKSYIQPKLEWVWPVRKQFQTITQGFGVAWSANFKKQHTGIDIAIPPKEDVFASAHGEIAKTGYLDQHGKWAEYVVVRHTNENYCTAYLHIELKSNIKVGKKIKPGEVIGSIADINGPHLHFNVWEGGYRKIVMRGALPLPQFKGKLPPFYDDPVFPNKFLDPRNFDYKFI